MILVFRGLVGMASVFGKQNRRTSDRVEWDPRSPKNTAELEMALKKSTEIGRHMVCLSIVCPRLTFVVSRATLRLYSPCCPYYFALCNLGINGRQDTAHAQFVLRGADDRRKSETGATGWPPFQTLPCPRPRPGPSGRNQRVGPDCSTPGWPDVGTRIK